MTDAMVNADKLQIVDIFDRYIDDGDAVGIAVSGGGDSVAMLLALKQFDQISAKKIKIVAISVDHKLRESSAVEVAQVSIWCEKLGIEHQILEWEFEKQPISAVQEKARDARYQLMCEYCVAHGIKKLLVAHNLEDNAETLLMRLRRGAGLRGLSSIEKISQRYVNDFDFVTIIRAFLEVKRADLRAFLKQNGQKWFDDVSNENENFERVKVRNFMGDTRLFENNKIAHSAKRLRQANEALEYYLNIFWQEKVEHLQYGIAKINIDDFVSLPEEMQLRLLARLVWTIGGGEYPTRWQKIEKLAKHINTQKSQKHCLGNCFVIVKKQHIWFGLENRQTTQFAPKRIEANGKMLWQSRLVIKNCLNVAIWVHDGHENVSFLADAPKVILRHIPNFCKDANGAALSKDETEKLGENSQLKIRY